MTTRRRSQARDSWLRRAAVALCAAGLGACVELRASTRGPAWVRTIQGTQVPGYYISPTAYEHYLRAQLYADQRQLERATEELRHALAADGASAYLHVRLGELLLQRGHVDEARDEAQAALALDPGSPEAYVVRAEVARRLGDREAAERALERALALDPLCEEAALRLTDLWISRGALGAVDTLWRGLLSQAPDSPMALELLGRLAAARGQQAEAEGLLRRALERAPGTEAARRALSALLAGQGRFDEAVQQLEPLFARSGAPAELERIVRLLVTADRIGAARARIDAAVGRLHPPEARARLLGLYLLVGLPREALGGLEQLLTETELPVARRLRGDTLVSLGRHDEALADYLRVPATDEEEWLLARARAARLDAARGRFREAAELLLAGQESGPRGGRDRLVVALAEVSAQAGDRGRAEQLLDEGLSSAPHSVPLTQALVDWAVQPARALERARALASHTDGRVERLLPLAGLLVSRGEQLDEARALLERVLFERPDAAEALAWLGRLDDRRGDLESAERALVAATRLAPADGRMLADLAALLGRRSDRTGALAAYRRAVAATPEGPTRARLEQELLLLESGRLGAR